MERDLRKEEYYDIKPVGWMKHVFISASLSECDPSWLPFQWISLGTLWLRGVFSRGSFSVVALFKETSLSGLYCHFIYFLNKHVTAGLA